MSFPLMPLVGATTTSAPGVEWTAVGNVSTATDLRGLAVDAGGLFVAPTTSSSLRSSTYGASWSSASVPDSVSTFQGIAYGAGLFVLSDGGGSIFSSPNGTTWTKRVFGVGFDDVFGVFYNDGYFIVPSADGGEIYASPNGISWSDAPQGTVSGFFECGIYVSSLNRTFVAGTSFRYVNAIPTATTAWTGTPTGLLTTMTGVAWSPTLSLAVAVGTQGVFSSPDLITWTRRTTLGNNAVAWCGDQFVAVGNGGRILTSPNGVTWTSRTSGTTENLTGVASQGGVILVVGGGGTVRRSP
jgi:hypothetical protein